MWEDMPQKSSSGAKFIVIFLILIIIAGLGFIAFIILSNRENGSVNAIPLPSPSEIASISPSKNISPSPSLKASPKPEITPSVDYKIPTGETFINSSTADTNGDNKQETLVITRLNNGKYHVYILSVSGENLFENKELTQKPVRIATQTYDTQKDSFLSWMLVFQEQSGNLAYIHWNGTQYEIPQNEGI